MKVADILKSKGTRIITVRLGETVETAARLLKSENIGALVVKDVCRTEGNVVLGMFSERDVVRALVDHGPAAMKMAVSALMTPKVIACKPDDDVQQVLELMDRHQIRHVPVLEEFTLVGVLSVRDVLKVGLAEKKSAEVAYNPAQHAAE